MRSSSGSRQRSLRPKGIHKNRWAVRTLMRAIHRLSARGLLKRVLAKQNDSAKNGSDRWLRCIRLERKFTEDDRKFFHATWSRNDKIAEPANDETEDDEVSDMEFEAQAEQEGHQLAPISGSSRPRPQWNPDVPLSNFLFNLLQASGPGGMSSKVFSTAARNLASFD